MLKHMAFPCKFISPAQHRLNLYCQHIQIKRFYDEIIPAHIDRHHQIHIVIHRRDKYDWQLRNFPDLCAPVKSIVERKPYIHQHQMRFHPGKFFHHTIKIRYCKDFIIPAL